MQVHLVIEIYNGVLETVEGFLDEDQANEYYDKLKLANKSNKTTVTQKDIEVE